jgi:hypothetical protein
MARNATDEQVVEVRDDKVGIVHLEIKHAHMSLLGCRVAEGT